MKRLVYLALLFSAACYAGQQTACETGRGPTPLPPTPTPTATPSPSPTPTPTPLPANDCRRQFGTVDFLFLSGPSVLARNETGRYDLTPKQYCLDPDGNLTVKDVPDQFNIPRVSGVDWSIVGQSDGIYAILVRDGFRADVTRLAGGITITLRVEFEGKFTQKVIQ